MGSATLKLASEVIPADPLDDLPVDAVIAVAMSGGVDSSVAAARCAQRGLRSIGITLAMWPRNREATRDRGCCSIDAVDDARRVCQTLDIPHYSWNLEASFHDQVITDFEEEYASGRTPNPCVRCNERIKFGELLERAQMVGATHIATGHYAQRGQRGENWTLHRAADRRKDQSYTLHRLNQKQLSAAVFPLGAMPDKAEVRNVAKSLGLITADKPDSQELCFVDISLPNELDRRLKGRFQSGEIVDESGDVIGQHRGLPFYTVGQRARLEIEPTTPNTEPHYVLRLINEKNQVVVGPKSALLRGGLIATEARWVSEAPAVGTQVLAQLRSHGEPHAAQVTSINGEKLELGFDPAVSQVSPGQPVVVLSGDEVLGGALIESSYV